MRNMLDLAMAVARAEGKKKQVNIAQIREILGIVSDLVYKFDSVYKLLLRNGKRRAIKRLKENIKK